MTSFIYYPHPLYPPLLQRRGEVIGEGRSPSKTPRKGGGKKDVGEGGWW